MSALLGTILLGQFVRFDIDQFRPLSDKLRVQYRVEKGMILEFRVVLNVKASDAIRLALMTALNNGASLGEVSIQRLAIGGRYLSAKVFKLHVIWGICIPTTPRAAGSFHVIVSSCFNNQPKANLPLPTGHTVANI